MKLFTKRLWIAGLLSLITFVFTSAYAEKTYQVEMIIFSHITKTALNNEKWPFITPHPINTSKLMDENQLTRVPPENQLLTKFVDRINNKPDYHVILSMAWTLTSDTSIPNQPIHIYGGTIYDNQGNLIGNAINADQPYTPNSIWQVNGTVKINVDRYFDVRLNLFFAAPRNEITAIAQNDYFATTTNNFLYFQLNQHRRMRSNELNYISQPMYGVLIQISPMDNTTA